MRKFFIYLLLAVAVVYGGIKLYFWMSLTNYADRLVQIARPVAHFSYGSTIVTLSGKLGLEDIVIRPNGYDTTITIKAITLQADNLWELYTISSSIRNGEMPENLGFNLVEMTYDPGSDFWQQSIGSPGLWGIMQLPYDSLYCGDRTRFSGNDFSRMGIQEVTATTHVGYTLNPASQHVAFYIKSVIPEFNKTSFRMESNINPKTLMQQVAAQRVELSFIGGEFRYTDLGWNAKVREFCAGEMKLTETDYVTGYADTVWQAMASNGIDVGPTLKQAYQKFLLHDSGELALTLNMSRPLKLQSLKYYAPQDILYYLNPNLTINGTPVSLEEIKGNEKFSRQSLQKHNRKILAKEDVKHAFSTIPLSQLNRHVGERVRLATSGRVFEGTLISVEERFARLQTRNYYGAHEEIVLLRAVTETSIGKAIKPAEIVTQPNEKPSEEKPGT